MILLFDFILFECRKRMEKVKTTKKGGTKIASLEEVKEAALMIQLF